MNIDKFWSLVHLVIRSKSLMTHWIFSDEVGAAIKNKISEGVVKREDLFIVSKLWNIFHQPDDVQRALDQSLTQLDLGSFSKRSLQAL